MIKVTFAGILLMGKHQNEIDLKLSIYPSALCIKIISKSSKRKSTITEAGALTEMLSLLKKKKKKKHVMHSVLFVT